MQRFLTGFVPETASSNQGGTADAKVEGDTNTMADAITKCYLGNYELVGALAHEYGFEYAFFWQPAISIGNKALTSDEREIRSSMDSAMVDLFAATYARVEQSAPEHKHLFYIADALDGQTSQIWIDGDQHVTPEGNQVVAEEMLRELGPLRLGQ